MMNVEIISKDKITPSSPTPQDHRIHKLSFADQLAPTHCISYVLFYQAKDNDDMNQVEKSSRLKDSLEQTLTHFYPLAGRVKEDHYVECNDEGVDYYEARVTCKLLEVLKHFNSEILSQFLPFSRHGKDSKAGSPEVLLVIQYNNFDCGGVAIGICLSHRIADGASATTFLNAQSATSRGDVLEAVYPIFNGATYFPPKDISWGRGDIAIAKDISFGGKYVAPLNFGYTASSTSPRDVALQALRNVVAEAPSAILCDKQTPMATPPQSKLLNWIAKRTLGLPALLSLPWRENGRNWLKISELKCLRNSDNLQVTRASQ